MIVPFMPTIHCQQALMISQAQSNQLYAPFQYNIIMPRRIQLIKAGMQTSAAVLMPTLTAAPGVQQTMTMLHHMLHLKRMTTTCNSWRKCGQKLRHAINSKLNNVALFLLLPHSLLVTARAQRRLLLMSYIVTIMKIAQSYQNQA